MIPDSDIQYLSYCNEYTNEERGLIEFDTHKMQIREIKNNCE